MITLDSPQLQILRRTEENEDIKKGHVWLRVSLILKIYIHLYWRDNGKFLSCDWFCGDWKVCGTW